MANIMKYAATSTGKQLTSAHYTLMAEIAAGIAANASRTQWEKMNVHMQAAMIRARDNASNKREFIKLAKQYTGLLKTNDPWIQWCIDQWY